MLSRSQSWSGVSKVSALRSAIGVLLRLKVWLLIQWFMGDGPRARARCKPCRARASASGKNRVWA